jgi:hypothetical protein
VPSDDKQIPLSLSLGEVNLILEALGGLPYVRVFELIGRLHEQASTTLQENA